MGRGRERERAGDIDEEVRERKPASQQPKTNAKLCYTSTQREMPDEVRRGDKRTRMHGQYSTQKHHGREQRWRRDGTADSRWYSMKAKRRRQESLGWGLNRQVWAGFCVFE